MQLWRLVKTRYAATAFDGEGARIYGGRWNSAGTRVAYASSNSALAVLEVLVHMTAGSVLPGYSLIRAHVPDSLVEEQPPSELPGSWRAFPVPPEVQAIGDAWIRSGRALALTVPSAIVEGSYNVLINPEHAAFSQLVVESSRPFGFDPRLVRR
jgi:RES domain-containing protein